MQAISKKTAYAANFSPISVAFQITLTNNKIQVLEYWLVLFDPVEHSKNEK